MATSVTSGQIFQWDDVLGADSYRVTLEELSGTPVSEVTPTISEAPADDLFFDGSGNALVTGGTSYTLRVRSVNEFGESTPSTLSITVSGPPEPGPVTVV